MIPFLVRWDHSEINKKNKKKNPQQRGSKTKGVRFLKNIMQDIRGHYTLSSSDDNKKNIGLQRNCAPDSLWTVVVTILASSNEPGEPMRRAGICIIPLGTYFQISKEQLWLATKAPQLSFSWSFFSRLHFSFSLWWLQANPCLGNGCKGVQGLKDQPHAGFSLYLKPDEYKLKY